MMDWWAFAMIVVYMVGFVDAVEDAVDVKPDANLAAYLIFGALWPAMYIVIWILRQAR